MCGIGNKWLLMVVAACACLSATSSPSLAAPQTAPVTYVALGDSYSAGVGTQAGRTHDNTCERTSSAWPNLLAKQSNLELLANLACSGAQTFNMFGSFKNEPSQAKRLKAMKPDVVTVTIGGNDAGFSKALYNCFRFDCTKGKLSQNGVAIDQLRQRLVTVFTALQRSVPMMNIVVVGYPRIFPANGQQAVGCGWLSKKEQADLNQLAADLDAQEQLAVQAAGRQLGAGSHLQYVSVQNALDGHELCSKNSWVFAIRPTCAIDSRCGHPLLPGQQAIANAVRRAIKLPKPQSGPKPAPQPAAPDKWPTKKHGGPPALFIWIGASFVEDDWESCSDNYCIVGSGDVVLVFKLHGINEIGEIPIDTADLRTALAQFGIPSQEITELLSP